MKKDIRQYTKQIKLIIASNITYLKKRLNIFPKATIKKLNRMKLEKEIEFQGKKYTSNQLTKEVLSKYRDLHKEINPFSYTDVLRPFIQECKQNEDNMNEVYEKYRNILTERLKKDKDDLYFCLDALKIIEKSFKE